jgi:hypothetical protein
MSSYLIVSRRRNRRHNRKIELKIYTLYYVNNTHNISFLVFDMAAFYRILHTLLLESYAENRSLSVGLITENPTQYYTHLFRKTPNKTVGLLALLIGIHLSTDNLSRLSKIQWLHSIRINKFIDAKTKSVLEDTFSRAQLIYHRLNRLVFNYRWNITPVSIHHDLLLNPITPTQKNTLTLLHYNRKYLFTLRDLTNLIETSLVNSPDMFAQPLVSKNPYTNMPFNKADLYNIYFAMKSGTAVLSPIIHNYFLENFHLKQFRINNEVLIRNIVIEKFVQSNEIVRLRNEIMQMIFSHNQITFQKRRIHIHRSFPTKKLVDIMRPYLRLYYISRFSLDNSRRDSVENELYHRLNTFAAFNNCFGRIYTSVQKKTSFSGDLPTRHTYNDTHIPWVKSGYNKHYETCHLDIVDSDSDMDDDISDDDTIEIRLPSSAQMSIETPVDADDGAVDADDGAFDGAFDGAVDADDEDEGAFDDEDDADDEDDEDEDANANANAQFDRILLSLANHNLNPPQIILRPIQTQLSSTRRVIQQNTFATTDAAILP